MYSRHCILILFFCFCIGNLYAQEWLWAVQATGTTQDNAFSVATDQNGNIYITGYFGPDGVSFETTFLPSRGSLDVFIVKFNSSGDLIWAKSAGGTQDDVGYSIAVDPSGNVCVAGTFGSDSISFDAIVLGGMGDYDAFVAKYDALGNLLWARSAGGPGIEDAYTIAADNNANIYIAGHFTSHAITFDQTVIANSNPGISELYLAKYDAGGNLKWVRSAEGSQPDAVYSCTSGNAGEVYITGFFRSPSISFDGQILTNSADAREMFLAKYSGDGEILWVRSAIGSLNDVGYTVRMYSDSEVVVSGSFRSETLDFGTHMLTNTLTGKLDFFVTKYDTSGEVVSVFSGGGMHDDYGWCHARGDGTSRFIGGGFQSESMIFGNDTLINAGDSTYDIFIIQYAGVGDILWSESIGATDNEYINWLSNDPTSQNVYVVGFFESQSIQIGNTQLQQSGDGDLFIARLAPLQVGVKKIAQEDQKLLVYPNPTSDHFMVEFSAGQLPYQLELFDLMGTRVFGQICFQKREIRRGIDYPGIPGLYIVRVKAGAHSYLQKVSLQN